MTQPTPRSTLFPYTTLFRSEEARAAESAKVAERHVGGYAEVAHEARAPIAAEQYQSTADGAGGRQRRSEEHTSELQSRLQLVCRLLLEKKKTLFTHDAFDRM